MQLQTTAPGRTDVVRQIGSLAKYWSLDPTSIWQSWSWRDLIVWSSEAAWRLSQGLDVKTGLT